jgi:hypothetical protein
VLGLVRRDHLLQHRRIGNRLRLALDHQVEPFSQRVAPDGQRAVRMMSEVFAFGFRGR